MAESANDFVIGDIENGFDVEKAKKLLNVALITENHNVEKTHSSRKYPDSYL